MPTDLRRELRRGLGRTRSYLLAHHRPAEYDRCHAVDVAGRRVHVCARCSGVYPGIVAGLTLFATGTGAPLWPWLVTLGPAPALVDWAVTTLGDRRGHNAGRTLTGILLGLAYGLAVPWFLTERPLWLVGVAVAYGAFAAIGLHRAGVGDAKPDDSPAVSHDSG